MRPKPTRAEIHDIQNSINDGVDAFILSPETAISHRFESALDQMSHICKEAEKRMDYITRYQSHQKLLKMQLHKSLSLNPALAKGDIWTPQEAIASCAVKASFDINASLIIVFTYTGLTPSKIAKHKPICPILAVSPNEFTAKAVLLHRGVESMVVGTLIGSELKTEMVLKTAQERELVKKGEFVVVTSGLSGTMGITNLLKVI